MPGPLIPEDDLYARLGLEPEATPEAIELAWRALLRRHHPDVAGESAAALERAKQINVAHDWLSDPELRARYDSEVMGLEPLPDPWGGSRGGRGGRDGRAGRATGHTGGGRRGRAWVRHPAAPRRPRPRPSTRPDLVRGEPEIRLARFMDRVRRLTPDELDRMAVAEPPPIAFAATIRRFASPEGREELDRVEAELAALLPHGRWAETGVREGLSNVATEIVLGPFLDDTLAEPFRSRAQERLLRAWDASLEQPRWGPNGSEVAALLARVAAMTPAEVAAFAGASRGVAAGDLPWPDALDPDEDEALRISAILAARDVAGALRVDGVAPATAARAQRLLARHGHIVALRHAFPHAAYAAYTAPFAAATGGGGGAPADDRPGPDVRRAR
jgi:curved DNA-binding protein CbpA